MRPLDTSVQAQYEDGFILDETEHSDIAQFGDGNIFRDILQKRPEAEHGPMVRFSCFYKDRRYDIDWSTLADNARPIRFRHGYATITDGVVVEQGFSGMQFGYQYTDENGKNHQEVIDL